jgi:ribonuclease Z
VATLTFLGSAGAVPAIGHDNTYLALEGDSSTLLIDCAGSPLQKLQLAGLDPAQLGYVLLTHRHPDHIYGFPILMLGLWLLGCQTPLQVLGEAEGLQSAQTLLGAFHPEEEWQGFCPPLYREIDLHQESVALDLPDLLLTIAPTRHLVPSMAVKLLDKATGCTVVYSSDTAPCDALLRLARGADVLIHEAAGTEYGHSSAAQAGSMAQRAGVGKLFLIHYPVLNGDLNALLAEARREFTGEVELARDFGTVEF